MKICRFWGKEFMSLSQKYEERVRKFSFLARHHVKAELYRYIYIVIFGKHLGTGKWGQKLRELSINSEAVV